MIAIHLIGTRLGRDLFSGWRIYSDEPTPRYLGWVEACSLAQLEDKIGPVRSLGTIDVTRSEVANSRLHPFEAKTCAT